LARERTRIEWAKEAFASVRNLAVRDRVAILKRLDWLGTCPEMYPTVGVGRWAGLRRFFAGSQVLYDGYWRDDGTRYVELTVPAVRRSGD